MYLQAEHWDDWENAAIFGCFLVQLMSLAGLRSWNEKIQPEATEWNTKFSRSKITEFLLLGQASEIMLVFEKLYLKLLCYIWSRTRVTDMFVKWKSALKFRFWLQTRKEDGLLIGLCNWLHKINSHAGILKLILIFCSGVLLFRLSAFGLTIRLKSYMQILRNKYDINE